MSGTTKKPENKEIDVDQKIEDTLEDWRHLKAHLKRNKEVAI
ncbi:hypothetical protein [Methanobacterium formicicum]|jgi:hypothetical protein|nr:hypothetical protein [Methanobacterium formicicum]